MILYGDCLDVMREMDADSVDLVCTDPPYGLKFMNRDWDKAVPSVDVWREALRVLKPGGFAFIMSSSRQDCFCEMLIRIREAGFKISHTFLSWAYATGFNKATNVGKHIDRKLGKEREVVSRQKRQGSAFMKEGAHWQNDNGKAIDGRSSDLIAVRVEQMSTEGVAVTAPATPEAALFEDWMPASSFKPAFEPIIVAMKPLTEKTYAAQALKSLADDSVGPGSLNMGAARIPYESEGDKAQMDGVTRSGSHNVNLTALKPDILEVFSASPQGRFPGNLIVQDDVLNDGRVLKSGKMDSIAKAAQYNTYGKMYKRHVVSQASSGSFSRFFSLDAWFAERIKQLPDGVQRTFPFLICPKPSKREKNKGCEGFEAKHSSISQSMPTNQKCSVCGGWKTTGNPDKRCVCEHPSYVNTPAANHHPTCKPLKLFSWLITLGSREGQLILDPFCGSGTTGVACKMLGRRFKGIELEQEYVDIAEARIAAHSLQQPAQQQVFEGAAS